MARKNSMWLSFLVITTKDHAVTAEYDCDCIQRQVLQSLSESSDRASALHCREVTCHIDVEGASRFSHTTCIPCNLVCQ